MRVTKNSAGKTWESLSALWAERDQAEAELMNWIRGEGVDPDMYAAANCSDEHLNIPGLEGLDGWDVLKREYMDEMNRRVDRAWSGRVNVRIATGHEPIGKLVCRPVE